MRSKFLRGINAAVILLTMLVSFAAVSREEGTRLNNGSAVDVAGAHWAIPPIYDAASGFQSGMAAVRVGDAWGFIDTTGRMVLEPQYNEGDAQFNAGFEDGLCAVRYGDRWGFIDKTGRIVINPMFIADMYEPPQFSHGLAAVRTQPGLHGYIDRQGNMVIQPAYYKAGQFDEAGHASVMLTYVVPNPPKADSQGYFEINRKGEPIDSPDGFVRTWSNDAYVFSSDSQKLGLKHRDGTVLLPAEYDWIGDLKEGLASVSRNERYGFIDENAKLVIPMQFSDADPFSAVTGYFSNGLALVFYPDATFGKPKDGFRPTGKYGYIDRQGRLTIPPKYDDGDAFAEGVACVRTKTGSGYINTTGKFVVEPKLTSCSPFTNGLAAVQYHGKYGWLKH